MLTIIPFENAVPVSCVGYSGNVGFCSDPYYTDCAVGEMCGPWVCTMNCAGSKCESDSHKECVPLENSRFF